jgi:Zn-dependent peptidase ImmA (M78 family)
VNVESDVLKWLIDSSGWTSEEIAKRINTTAKDIERIKSGEKQPTLKQLQDLSIIFKRPLAAFLLSKPIHEKPKPKDYRMLPERLNKFDKKTILVLRRSRRLQELSKELSKNINYDVRTKLPKVNLSTAPEKLALRYRDVFGLTEEKQRKLETSYELFYYLRDIFEDLNVYVFQFSMPVEDSRGFVFVDDTPAVIVVNTRDSIEARLFTLMHEFAHILLGESVIDLPDAISISKNNIERWCNEFSSSFLFPQDIAKKTFDIYKENLTQRATLNSLSRKYKVSKALLLLDMLRLHYIRKEDYDNILDQYKPKIKPEKERGEEEPEGGGIPSEIKCISEVGNKFVSLVANNYDREFITYTDALNYLSIKSKNFDKVLSKAKK